LVTSIPLPDIAMRYCGSLSIFGFPLPTTKPNATYA
jgi:hypothetical protein